MFEKLKPTIMMSRCQKQKGGADCGLFAIANATAIAFGKNPCKLQFMQASLRSHLVDRSLIVNEYLIKNSQAVKKGVASKKARAKKDVKSKVVAKKWL